MKKTILFLGLIIVVIMALSSCGKKGCTDSYATNFCDKCKKDDGSCQYKASVQFWFDNATSDSLLVHNHSLLTFSIDGSAIGQQPFDYPFLGTGTPSCNLKDYVVFSTKELGNSKLKTSTYKVVDQNNVQVWSGNVTFDATKSCTSIQLSL